MHRVMWIALLGAHLGLSFKASIAYGQQQWGSLSGKVTLAGKIPPVVDLVPQMKKHADAACCLDPKAKPEEKVDRTWVVDAQTKGVKNVFVYLFLPEGKEFPIHPDLLKRKEKIEIDQPHCVFIPRVQAFQPFHLINGKEVPTGQKMYIKNSAPIPHNANIPKAGINPLLPAAGGQINLTNEKKLVPNNKLPYEISCGVHTWMKAQLFVFNHPYYTITKADGTFEIPIVPAGAEFTVMAWHEGVGYVLTGNGKSMKLQPGKNMLNIEIPSPVK
jgi:hypothetical protein